MTRRQSVVSPVSSSPAAAAASLRNNERQEAETPSLLVGKPGNWICSPISIINFASLNDILTRTGR